MDTPSIINGNSEKSHFFLVLVCLLFCSTIMTGEPAHTTLEERMVPDLMFLSECVPPNYQLLIGEVAIMLCIQLYSACY